ncbi:hypothetical protein DV735_g5174, partial [Chaetothyriales sp. CBS 134920]
MDNTFTVVSILRHNSTFYKDNLAGVSGTLRLVGILPGAYSDRVECVLKTQPSILVHRPQRPFSALSYSWSDEPGWTSIWLNGRHDFRIGNSLFAALRRLRRTPENDTSTEAGTFWIWVDAVCINQANTDEKNSQVSQMADVYRQAERVYVWLGRCGATTLAEPEPEHCNAHALNEADTVDFLMKRGPEWVNLCEARPGGDRSQWWWRMWIVQEIGLARDVRVLIGPHRFSTWENAVRALNKSWVLNEPGFQARNLTKRRWQDLPERKARNEAWERVLSLGTLWHRRDWLGANLFYLLFLTASQHASLPQDKIIGLLGLVDPNACAFTMQVDYSVGSDEVFARATEYLLQEAGTLDVLYEHWPTRQSPSPSWVIDFSRGLRHPASMLSSGVAKPSKNTSSATEPQCRASGRGRVQFRVDGKTLVVRGLRVAHVVATARWVGRDLVVRRAADEPEERIPVDDIRDDKVELPCEIDEEQDEVDAGDRLRTMMLRWLESFARLPRRGHGDGKPEMARLLDSMDRTEQFARTISADGYLRAKYRGHPISGSGAFGPHIEGFRKHKRSFEFRTEAFSGLLGRTFFVAAEQGLCGLCGSETVEPGDAVMAVHDAGMLMAVRDVQGESGVCFMGECFISGLMYGELAGDTFAFESMMRDVHLI